MTLFEKSVFAVVINLMIKRRSFLLSWQALNPMTSILIETNRGEKLRNPRRVRGRDWNYITTNQEMPEVFQKCEEIIFFLFLKP